ncbi:MAG: hypothetical protein WC783_00600 [Candidatus Paceibacterota bacterium]|jgi:hypothetical protein
MSKTVGLNGNRLISPEELSAVSAYALKTLANWRSLRRGPKFIKKDNRIWYRVSDVNKWFKTESIN